MHSHHTPAPISSHRVLVTDHIPHGLAGGDGRHYESPPQSEQQARALVAALVGVELSDRSAPWRQAIAGGQRIIELRSDR
jgi:hypothetical protein